MTTLEILQLFVSSAILGVIWIVQLLLYPSFELYDRKIFQTAMKHHQKKISLIMAPLMISELFLILFFSFNHPSHKNISLLIMIALIWILTFTIFVPLHTKLLKFGYDQSFIKKLILTNWLRTILWTVTSIIIILSKN